MRSTVSLAILTLALMMAPAAAKSPPAKSQKPMLRLADRWAIGGEGGWDYIAADADARRLYVSHGTRVEVLELDHGTKLAGLEPTPGVHGVAVARDLNRGFVSCGRESSVMVFSLDSLKEIARVPVQARNPDAILYEPASKRALTFNGGTANVTVIDAATNTVAGMIDVGGKPEFAVQDGHGRVFVNIEDRSEVLELDPAAIKVLRRWSIAPGEEPTGLAMDRAHRRLFSVCGNKLMVISDADKGSVVATAPIGGGVDGVVFDAKRALAISSNGEGTVTVVHEDSPAKFSVVETDATERGARTITLDEKTGTVFLPTASFDEAHVPAPTPERPHPRPPIVPGSFRVLIMKP